MSLAEFAQEKKKEPHIIETPQLPPAAGTPLDRPLPAPVKQAKQTALTLDDACADLTTAAIQAVIDKITESCNKAQSDADANGMNGAYASAARDNLSLLTMARDKMCVLRDWLHTAGIIDPPPFVTNTTGAYNVHGYVRETVVNLHYARHWATISAVYHSSVDALDSFELTTQALNLIEPLGAQAGRCYMSAYEPFTKP